MSCLHCCSGHIMVCYPRQHTSLRRRRKREETDETMFRVLRSWMTKTAFNSLSSFVTLPLQTLGELTTANVPLKALFKIFITTEKHHENHSFQSETQDTITNKGFLSCLWTQALSENYVNWINNIWRTFRWFTGEIEQML